LFQVCKQPYESLNTIISLYIYPVVQNKGKFGSHSFIELQTNFAGILLQHHFLFFMSKILNTAKKANMEQYDSGFQKSGRKKSAYFYPTQNSQCNKANMEQYC
jgi:hypothetical protein